MTDNKYHYKFTQDATEDLESIYAYSNENWGKKQAKRYLQKLQNQCDLLCITPSIGKKSDDIDDSSYRFPYAEHMLYYKVRGTDIIIYAILHKSMLPESHLTDR